jgi:hypothetical protein
MTDTVILLMVAEVKERINPEYSLEDRLRTAMEITYHHWTTTDLDKQFKGAVAGVYSATEDEDERLRIQLELETLRDLSAMLSGVPINFDAIKPLENPIGLMKLWREVTGQKDD